MSKHYLSFPSTIPSEPGFSFYRRFIPSGTEYSLHWHDYYEFEIIVSGHGEHIYNGSIYDVSSGSAYMMCFNDFHALKAITDLTLYSIHFSKGMLNKEFSDYLEFNKFCCQFTSEETQRIIQNLLQMSEESQRKLPFSNTVIKNCLSDIIIYMIRKSTNNKKISTPPPIQQAVAYINENFRQHITLKDVAEKLSFSPNYFGRIFKNETGIPFNEYVNTLRLKYACNLLTVSNLTTKEIALSSGYSSLEYFLYTFKQKLQLTPSQYRDMTQKRPSE